MPCIPPDLLQTCTRRRIVFVTRLPICALDCERLTAPTISPPVPVCALLSNCPPLSQPAHVALTHLAFEGIWEAVVGVGPSSQNRSPRHVSRKHLPWVFIALPEQVLTAPSVSPMWDCFSFQRSLALLVWADRRVGVFRGPLLPRGHSALR